MESRSNQVPRDEQIHDATLAMSRTVSLLPPPPLTEPVLTIAPEEPHPSRAFVTAHGGLRFKNDGRSRGACKGGSYPPREEAEPGRVSVGSGGDGPPFVDNAGRGRWPPRCEGLPVRHACGHVPCDRVIGVDGSCSSALLPNLSICLNLDLPLQFGNMGTGSASYT